MINIKDVKIEPLVIHFDVTAKQPTAEVAAALSHISFSQEKLGSNKKRASGKKMKTLSGAIGKAVVLLLLAGFMLLMLVTGAFQAGSAMRGIVWLVVIITPIIALVGVLSGIYQLFSPAKTKNPESVYAFWEELVFEENFFNKDGCNKPEKRTEELIDLTPETLDSGKVSQYIYDTWKTLANAMNEITLPVQQKYGLQHSYTKIERATEPTTILYENVTKIKSTITITDTIKFEGSQTPYFFEPVIVKVNVTQYLTKAGNYWYPIDITPAMSRIEAIDQIEKPSPNQE